MRYNFINLISGIAIFLSLHGAFRSEHGTFREVYLDELLLCMSIYLRPMSIYEMVDFDVVEQEENIQSDLPLRVGNCRWSVLSMPFNLAYPYSWPKCLVPSHQPGRSAPLGSSEKLSS